MPVAQDGVHAMEDRVVDGFFIVAGIIVIIFSTGLAIRTFMIPGGPPPWINRFLLRITQEVFNAISRPIRSDSYRHQVLSLYAPISLLAVLTFTLSLLGFGYALAFYGVGIRPFIRAMLFSGSALSTLGFESPGNNAVVISLSVIEALTVVTVVAVLVGYVPGIFGNYQEREKAVHNLDLLAGPHPDGIKVVDAYTKTLGASQFGDLWKSWLEWFAQLATARSTLSGDLYLRSSRWDRSWICAAGAILDAAALVDSSVELSTDPAADKLVHFGARSLRDLLEPWQLRCPPQPVWPHTAINVSQQEFAEAFAYLNTLGLPMKADKDKAWQDFAQLRVQYECALMALVRLKRPPSGARWSTDRPEADQKLPLPLFAPRDLSEGAPTSKSSAVEPPA